MAVLLAVRRSPTTVMAKTSKAHRVHGSELASSGYT